ncbi:potassium channel family protein [Formosa sp. PL04]|uniref:potassium channel family protein n=1 Tax=Formosa sp. PL04 TaxID=3081755 RepID=UPI00298115D2|nr:potassium channel family protein [Formosa sp. PL04]MDW5290344.1 potassium channel family protein [Formosa sp. PL04]
MNKLNRLHNYRFEIFFATIIIILFSPIFLVNDEISDILNQLAIILNFLAGIVLLSKNKRLMKLFFILVGIIIIFIIRDFFHHRPEIFLEYVKLACYFTFYIIVSFELIKQVIKAKLINRNVIIGLMCGYICLGLVCFFAFFTIEFIHPGSFNGVDFNLDVSGKKDALLYFSYISLLTIGYGDITPATVVAQKATMLTGLAGQFYMVILTAIIVGKYISQTSKESKNG